MPAPPTSVWPSTSRTSRSNFQCRGSEHDPRGSRRRSTRVGPTTTICPARRGRPRRSRGKARPHIAASAPAVFGGPPKNPEVSPVDSIAKCESRTFAGVCPSETPLARTYRQLDLDQRRTLFRLVEARTPVGEIAERLGCHPATIYRELGRNRFRDGDRGFCGYFPLNAQDLARRRRQRRGQPALEEGPRGPGAG